MADTVTNTMADLGEITDITIDNLRYVKTRRMWGAYEQDVLEIYRLDAQYPYPTWECTRDTANAHIWQLFESVCGRAKVTTRLDAPSGSAILHNWVAELGLRHQGVLVSAVRGPDNETKHGPSKPLVRFYRACVLKAHCIDPRKSATYLMWIEKEDEFWDVANKYLGSFDHFYNHFVMHFLAASEICGYKMPNPHRQWWHGFYLRMCQKLHLSPETERQLDNRLNADEQQFAKSQL